MVSANTFCSLFNTVGMRIELTVFSTCSIDRAYKDENTPGVDPHQDRHAYNREDYSLYPYKSHWQTFRAWYGLVTCSLLVFFNGWRSVVPPGSVIDFIPSYINVSFLELYRISATKIHNTYIYILHFLASHLHYSDGSVSYKY
jgi:hypothetical protein